MDSNAGSRRCKGAIVVAGTHSGVGKTSMSIGIMAALRCVCWCIAWHGSAAAAVQSAAAAAAAAALSGSRPPTTRAVGMSLSWRSLRRAAPFAQSLV
jgi:hypothetical protein